MTEQLALSTQTPDSEPASSLLEVHVTYVHRVDNVDLVNEILEQYKSWEGDPSLFNSASFVAELVDLPDGGHQLMISSNSGVIQ